MSDRQTVQGVGVTRRDFIAGVGATAAAILAGARLSRASGPSAAPPNIVLIFADDLGWGELGCYGQTIIQTPNLDRMAAEGIRFTDYYSAAPICAPSRCSLLTGMHQGHASVRHNTFNEIPEVVQASLAADEPTFAEVAKQAGYATGLFGKWGFGPDNAWFASDEDDMEGAGHPSHPLQKGFDEFFGFIYHHHATQSYWADYAWEGNSRVDISENAGGARGVYLPEVYTARALKFIERHASEPFLVELATTLPHTPNHVPDWSQYDDLPMATDTKKHAAMITLLDEHVGRVLDKLQELGIAENTVVFFTSDNGPHNETAVYGGTDPIPVAGVTSVADEIYFDSNGPFRGAKQNIYEGGIRVPMIAWSLGLIPAESRGSVSAFPCVAYDVLRTFADLAGAVSPASADGISLRPVIEGRVGDVAPRAHLYWERFMAGAPTPLYYASEPGHQGRFAQAVRKGRWKLIRWAPGTRPDGTLDVNPTGLNRTPAVPVPIPKELWDRELYDLVADPGETTNLALLNPDVVAELDAILDVEHVDAPSQLAQT